MKAKTKREKKLAIESVNLGFKHGVIVGKDKVIDVILAVFLTLFLTAITIFAGIGINSLIE